MPYSFSFYFFPLFSPVLHAMPMPLQLTRKMPHTSRSRVLRDTALRALDPANLILKVLLVNLISWTNWKRAICFLPFRPKEFPFSIWQLLLLIAQHTRARNNQQAWNISVHDAYMCVKSETLGDTNFTLSCSFLHLHLVNVVSNLRLPWLRWRWFDRDGPDWSGGYESCAHRAN